MGITIELLDAAKVATGCHSDYQLAKHLGWHIGTVSMYRTGKRNFDDDAAATIAGILGREPGEVMALCAASRAKTEAGRSRWLRVAALLAAAVMPPAAGAQASNNGEFGSIIRSTQCQLSAIRRWMFGGDVRLA